MSNAMIRGLICFFFFWKRFRQELAKWSRVQVNRTKIEREREGKDAAVGIGKPAHAVKIVAC